MTLSLHGAIRKLLFVALVVAPLFFFLRAAAHPSLADRLASEPSRDALRRASEYEPANAERYYAYARYLQLVEQDFRAAAWNFRAATNLNPHRGRYWIELAGALRFLGDTNGEGAALHEAIRRDPTNPTVAWDAANFFLARDEMADAVREFRLAIGYDASRAPAAFDRLWQHSHDAATIMRDALPPGTIYYAALMDLFIRQDQPQAAAELWQRWVALPDEIPAHLSFHYLDYLCGRGDYEHALAAWRALSEHSQEVRSRQTADNLISNGGFEDAILDGGFEWRYRRNALAALELDTTRFHSGSSSLRIDFSGQTGSEAGIAQFVVLPPDQAFTFRGFMRGEAIYSTHGPRFTVTDAASGATLYASDESVGTTSWIERRGIIQASPAWRLVAVRVTRDPETHITGRAWIDDISITAGDAQ